MQVWRVPFSADVERVAPAARLKGVDVVAFPSLRYGEGIDPAGPDPSHHALHRHRHPLPPRSAAWASRLGRR